MKLNLKQWQLPVWLAFLMACNNQNADQTATKDSTTTSTSNQPGATMDSSKRADSKDAQFVKEVVAGNIGEIKLAQLAEKKGSGKEVKDLGKMLEREHTAVLAELKSYAARKNIDVPAEQDQDAKNTYNDFSKKSGKEFDKDWCDLMEKKHKAGISKFENLANDPNADPELKTLVNKTLPTLRTHLDHVMQCKNKLK